jgi:hypothetical protein
VKTEVGQIAGLRCIIHTENTAFMFEAVTHLYSPCGGANMAR